MLIKMVEDRPGQMVKSYFKGRYMYVVYSTIHTCIVYYLLLVQVHNNNNNNNNIEIAIYLSCKVVEIAPNC